MHRYWNWNIVKKCHFWNMEFPSVAGNSEFWNRWYDCHLRVLGDYIFISKHGITRCSRKFSFEKCCFSLQYRVKGWNSKFRNLYTRNKTEMFRNLSNLKHGISQCCWKFRVLEQSIWLQITSLGNISTFQNME